MLSEIADSVILFQNELTPEIAIHSALVEIPLRGSSGIKERKQDILLPQVR